MQSISHNSVACTRCTVCWKLFGGQSTTPVPFLYPPQLPVPHRYRHTYTRTHVHTYTHTHTHIHTHSSPLTVRRYLSPNILQALHQIHNTLLEIPKLDAQHTRRPGVIITIKPALGEIAPLDVWAGQLIVVLREVLPDDLDDLLVAEGAGRGEEPLAGGGGHLDSLDVGEGEITNVDPDEGSRVGDLLFGFALEDVACALVGGV